MTAVGPVCHIPPKTVITARSPVPIPAVPPAITNPTLNELANSFNILRQIIIIITGQNNGGPQSGQIGNSSASPGGSFQEVSVTTATKRVFQNNDKTSPNWVDVEYVQQLKMANNATKSTWVYNAAKQSDQ